MKNSNEWVADIREKLNTRYANRRKKRILFSTSVALAAVLIVAGITVYPKLIQSDPPRVSAGPAVGPPSVNYNKTHYYLSSIKGDNSDKFVGDYLATVKGNFIQETAASRPIETDKLYRVAGLNPKFVICANTSKGWEFFQNDNLDNGAELYGDAGLNLLNQYESVSYFLEYVGANSVENQPHKKLNLSKNELDSLFEYLKTQPFSDPPPGPYKVSYMIECKLKNGITVYLSFMDNKTTGFIASRSFCTKLNASLQQKLDSACK